MKIGPNQYNVRGSVKIKMQTLVTTADANADSSIYLTTKPVVPSISGVLSDSGGLSMANIIAVNGQTITVYLMNGKSYVLSNGTYCGEAELNNEDGTLPFMFSGPTCNEQVATS
jgi:hypothetical protein